MDLYNEMLETDRILDALFESRLDGRTRRPRPKDKTLSEKRFLEAVVGAADGTPKGMRPTPVKTASGF